MDKENLKDPILKQTYLAGRTDERSRITAILMLDLILLKAKTPEEFLSRALQMINHEDTY
jgi:hypothetical protein